MPLSRIQLNQSSPVPVSSTAPGTAGQIAYDATTGFFYVATGTNQWARASLESFAAMPLDVYGGAAAAYSLRRIRSAYTGPVVRVRRSSDNTERDCSANDITNGTLLAFVGNGDGFVATWYDQAGSFNLTQPTAARQPRLVASGVFASTGGKRGIDFGIDSSSKPVSMSVSLSSVNANWAALGVVTFKSGAPTTSQVPSASSFEWSYGRWLSIGTPGTQDYNNTSSMLCFVTNRTGFGENPPAVETGYNNIFAGKSIAYDQQYIIVGYKSGNTVYTLVNGVAGESFMQSGTLNGTTLQVGANVQWLTEGNSNLWGVVHEIIYYQTDKASDISGLTTTVNQYYGSY
jgi:hypothetical protein